MDEIQIQSATGLSKSSCDHGFPAVLPNELFAHLPEPLKSSRGGRGVPFPVMMDGQRVALLRCGQGFDAFVLSKLVGNSGQVIAFDPDPLAVESARHWQAAVASVLGYSNVSFVSGDPAQLPFEAGEFDVVISACALSLWAEPRVAFEEFRRILKPGAEFILSEVVASCRVPRRFRYRPEYLPCLARAVYVEDLRRAMHAAGFPDVRTLWQRRAERVESVRFTATTLCGFNLPLEDRCEDYGQFVVYRGTIPDFPEAFPLDAGHFFRKGEMHAVCKNTADMLRVPRYAPHFEVSREHVHKGVFDCGPGTSSSDSAGEEEPLAGPSICGPGCC